MWLWDIELHALGFRRKSERYWQCQRRFELSDMAYLSLFSWSEQFIPTGDGRYLVELSEFHVTFLIGLERIHFYYHERSENTWTAAGHTSSREIRRLGADPRQLRTHADVVAAAFILALGGVYQPRRSSGHRDGLSSTD